VAPQPITTGTPPVVDGKVSVPVLLIVAITGAVRVLLVRVCVPAMVVTVPLVDGNVIVVESVPENVSVLLMVAVLLDAITSVPPVTLETKLETHP
jgi:hypothetical protein